mmetsp:Transcript_32575/g.55313  ORF Transcript_32575/g.55313 Transcript_32575/m.55313 type:complete len:90 (+) Transcript_32575:1006-1275(+)
MQYKGVTGRFGSSLIRSSPFELTVMGEHGVIRIAAPANCPDTASLTSFQDSSKTTFMPFPCCVSSSISFNTQPNTYGHHHNMRMLYDII